MKSEQFYALIEDPSALTTDHLSELSEIIQEYPFCESAWMLMLKTLHSTGSIRFDNELRRASAYISNKSALYTLIHTTYAPKAAAADEEDEKPLAIGEEAAAVDTQDYFGSVSDELPEVAAGPQADYFGTDAQGYSLDDTEKRIGADGRGTFSDWLDYMNNHQGYEEAEDENRARNIDLIESFLQGTDPMPRKRPEPELCNEEIEERVKTSVSENDGILTETLARIYIEQKQYAKAINIFKKLSLKNPEKSIYFATRISELEKLNE